MGFGKDMFSSFCHDHQAPFWHLVLLLVEVSSGDVKRKYAATCTIHLGPSIFLQILDPL